ncbi:hypothetical protein TrVE_jg11202 [Triparma verrucosa]|uniref:Uncharacterized protein n=1 Tax=Triparma verrucosa TaxID=1606542 RepID=A0A9W7C692_9STRA|nr:hypothetical protein TrVE_jg11202 [Triparma verrucosa]
MSSQDQDAINLIHAQFAAISNDRNILKASINAERDRGIQLHTEIKKKRIEIEEKKARYTMFEDKYVAVSSALQNEKEREKNLASKREKLGLEQRTLNENVEALMLEHEVAVTEHNRSLVMLYEDLSEQLDSVYDDLLVVPNSSPEALATLDKLVTESPTAVPDDAKPLIQALSNERMTAAKITEDMDKLDAMTKRAFGCALHIKDKLVDHNSVMASNTLGGTRTSGALECDKMQEYFENVEAVVTQQAEYKGLNLREFGDLEKDLAHIRTFALEETEYPRGNEMLLA